MSELQAAIVPVTPFQQNCTLVFDKPSMAGVVVDPGGDVPLIMEAIGKTGMRVEAIWLTHGHIDHAGGVADLRSALAQAAADGEAPPVIGPDERDRFLLDGLSEQGRQLGFDAAKSCTPDRWLSEGDELTLAGDRFKVLHCPGHTPGHVVFVNERRRFMLVGDVIFKGSVGRTDFPYGDHDALIAAIRTKLFPLGDDMAFLCGHGQGSTLALERQTNPFVGDRAHKP